MTLIQRLDDSLGAARRSPHSRSSTLPLLQATFVTQVDATGCCCNEPERLRSCRAVHSDAMVMVTLEVQSRCAAMCWLSSFKCLALNSHNLDPSLATMRERGQCKFSGSLTSKSLNPRSVLQVLRRKVLVTCWMADSRSARTEEHTKHWLVGTSILIRFLT